MADSNLSQNPPDHTGRDNYIVGLALAHAWMLMGSMTNWHDRVPSSDFRDVHTLLRAKYSRPMIAALLRQAHATVSERPLSEEDFAMVLTAFDNDVVLEGDLAGLQARLDNGSKQSKS